MEWKGTQQGVTVIDDYGHHPTEIRATLKALRLLKPRRLIVLFQPHRYTRTQALLDEFAGAFHDADAVRVLDIYAASEAPIAGVTSEELVKRVRQSGHPDAVHAGSVTGAVASVLVELCEGDLVVTQGAGSVTQAGELILKGLKREESHG
jgi:UDP-N-acetylmuramate--alanine ligase